MAPTALHVACHQHHPLHRASFMMFPKYIQTDDGHLVVFDAGQNHGAIAKRLPGKPLSAGTVSAAIHPRGKFFGESTTLLMASDRTLDWSSFEWHQGAIVRQPAFGTSKAMLAHMGARDVHAARLHLHERVYFLCGRPADLARLYAFFLP